MKSITQIIDRIEDKQILGRIPEELIEAAEKKLNVRFSKEYKQYTKAYGAVSMQGREYTGAVSEPNLDVVRATESARAITPDVDARWYVVEDPHIDGIIIWQDENGKIYRTAPHTEAKNVADSLAEYILK